MKRRNAFQFRKGNRFLPKGRWETLTPVMVRRYMEWIEHCDSRWEDEYKVTVRVAINGKLREHRFLFEERAHAIQCEQWWQELGYHPTLNVII